MCLPENECEGLVIFKTITITSIKIYSFYDTKFLVSDKRRGLQ